MKYTTKKALRTQVAQLERDLRTMTSDRNVLLAVVDDKNDKIQDLKDQVHDLTFTTEVKADTEAAFSRGQGMGRAMVRAALIDFIDSLGSPAQNRVPLPSQVALDSKEIEKNFRPVTLPKAFAEAAAEMVEEES